MNKKEPVNKKGKVLALFSLLTGWAIPILGVTLGIIGYCVSETEKYKKYNRWGIIISLIFWLFSYIMNLIVYLR